ncbi:MAG: 1-acyl-sn-glycerol-3-phosphate acyltransferase [Clostridiales bacterium]|nr:1-acyl-sn-glycerol-3-phosphate acyltransferase [Clostridiales bacterium]
MKYLLWALYAVLGLLGALVAAIILYFLFVFFCSLFIDKKKEYNKDSKFFRFLMQTSTGIGMRIMRIHYDLVDLDKIPEGKQMLFVCNHRSNFDPLISWRLLRKHYPSFISKEENFKIPFYGRYITRSCFMSIDRENPRNAMKTIERASKLLEENEVSIAVYPEGTRSKGCELLPFHNGVFKIAQKANVPVVVLTIQGTERVARNYPWKRTLVRLKCVGVIPADQVKGVKTSIVADQAREMMEKDLSDFPI